MDILLVRHGIAVERGTPGYEDDSLRPLTPAGRERMVEAARGLERLFTPQAILTSPLVRAAQTADILQAVYRLGKPQTCRELANGDHPGVIARLEECDAGSIALVGHEPWMGELLSLLLSGYVSAVEATFKKGACALVRTSDLRPGNCWLEWLIQPAALRRIAQASTAS
ncbi:MAG TPA: histidine phosphatase family protein [Tepidiformaceae bacterium]|nr:histidine phosphatase family protein [Tepidiformaceae bacterium]